MRLILDDLNPSDTQYVDLDEKAVIVKALQLYRDANKPYTNAYGGNTRQSTNEIVATRLLQKLKAE